MFVDK